MLVGEEERGFFFKVIGFESGREAEFFSELLHLFVDVAHEYGVDGGSGFGGGSGVCLSFGGEGVLGFLTTLDVGGGGLASGGVDGDESLLDGLGVGDGVEGEVGAVVLGGGGAGGDVKKSRIPPRSAA